MKSNELRIGNIIEIDQYPNNRVITTIECGNDIDQVIKLNGKPIPLTEEWLLKFGFLKYKYGHNAYRQKSFIIEEGLLKNYPYGFRKRIFKEDSLGLTYLKHVHQLQNLYFALTGEELQINE